MRKIITYGTFDLFHEGHLSIIERAKALGDYLVVGVTGENYDMERGKLNVRDSLPTRIENVRKTGLADEIIVEEYPGQKIRDISKYGIDAIALGSDWTGKLDYLKQYCDVVYLERTKNVSSTKLRESNGRIYRLGIISDDETDRDIVSESRSVSGLEVCGAYISNAEEARRFCAKYDLGEAFSSLDALFDASDIVYVRVNRESRYDCARRALERGKHVIMDFPSASRNELNELYEIAKRNEVVLYGSVPLAFLHTFRQLLWLLHGKTIGHVMSVSCVMPRDGDAADTAILPVFAFVKILGADAKNTHHFSFGREICAEPVSGNADARGCEPSVARREDSEAAYDRLTVEYADACASVEFGTSEWMRSGMTILGSLGRVEIPGKWWNMSYFKADVAGEESAKRYSFNAQGSGFRYLLHDMLLAIESGREEPGGMTREESLKIMDILEKSGLLRK
ncbi:MAG: adenylyltransferase/cytidyltransferase family protein [Clostridiales Family XIII bacterium]|jgi:glycerol-3-phosphate cytidylyltransferase|nr:adenylyltransferase/cytidyltransferase family protein [Clostridiales Family XIII bacterium]